MLGVLTGRGLIEPRHEDAIAAHCATSAWHEVARTLAENESRRPVRDRAVLLRRYFNLTGTTLKNLICETATVGCLRALLGADVVVNVAHVLAHQHVALNDRDISLPDYTGAYMNTSDCQDLWRGGAPTQR
ncbi:hypothetical protein [Streptomyces sp. NBC_00872]|uniref:hypothetical protein n=1 Tax=Streptomyces sp. NBC_00872 TaxID=2903686 RepID=UPI00386AF6C6|nr:hypothetical protein OG214_00245 [Streptomyces sp. NBC_00872]